MKYKIIKEYTPSELEEKVNKHLASGWMLQGGVSISYSPGGANELNYVQAMTKQNP